MSKLVLDASALLAIPFGECPLKTGFSVLTADRRWAEVPGQVKVELIR